MTQGPVTNDSPVAVIEGPKGKAEIYEYLVRNIIEYQVKFNDQTKTFITWARPTSRQASSPETEAG